MRTVCNSFGVIFLTYLNVTFKNCKHNNINKIAQNNAITTNLRIAKFENMKQVLYMGVGSGGQEGPWSPLDFHTWYKYSR